MDADNVAYDGGVNIEYGGSFFNLSDDEWKYGYCSAVRVSDLDGGCGFRGAVMVEKITINGADDEARIRKALGCVRQTWEEVQGMDERGKRCAIAYALMSYGYTDPDDDNYHPHTIVIQTERDGPMAFDGWKADFRMSEGADLKGLIRAKYVNF